MHFIFLSNTITYATLDRGHKTRFAIVFSMLCEAQNQYSPISTVQLHSGKLQNTYTDFISTVKQVLLFRYEDSIFETLKEIQHILIQANRTFERSQEKLTLVKNDFYGYLKSSFWFCIMTTIKRACKRAGAIKTALRITQFFIVLENMKEVHCKKKDISKFY